MFFILSKTIAFLLLPSNFLLILAFAGVMLLATRWRRAGLRIVTGAVVLLAIVALLPVGTVLIHALESRFPPWGSARGAPDGIIVLGGGISPKLSKAFGQPVFNGSASRVLAIAKLARDYPNARIGLLRRGCESFRQRRTRNRFRVSGSRKFGRRARARADRNAITQYG